MASSNPLNDIANLQTNVEEMFASIKAIHGEEYSQLTTYLFVLMNQIQTLEQHLCSTSRAYIQMMEHCIPEDNQRAAVENNLAQVRLSHSIAHTMGDQCVHAASYIVVILEEKIPEYKDLQKNLEALMGRVQTDWKDKGH